jgi:hypothetical protein
MKRLQPIRSKRGVALVAAVGALLILGIAAAAYVDYTNTGIRIATRQTQDVQTTHLSEAGVQSVLRNLWRNFKVSQSFTDMDTACNGASTSVPRASSSGDVPTVGRFAASVIRYSTPLNAANQPDTWTRDVTVRAVGYMDRNGNAALDAGEPRKIVDVMARFSLRRSEVFDYTYFVNNYGWFDGFQPSWLVMNGDIRANGNMSFLNGMPTVNGSIYAASNDKLVPPAAGLVNLAPVKWDNATYAAAAASNQRMRQVYDTTNHGVSGTAQFEQWRDFVFNSDGGIANNRLFGSVIADSTGTESWTRTSSGATPNINILDTRPTEELIMPDLSDLNRYITLSQNYVNTRTTFADGTADPNAGQGAYLEVWNNSTNAYQRVSTNGVVTGSIALIGTSSRPIKIHGPVTITQDAVIKGHISGQGTLYTGRNVHVVGSVRYSDPPDFRGSNPTAIDNANEKKDVIALAARGSVIMGNVAQFSTPYPLTYMTPPFTKGRYDDAGNWIPPFNALEVDGTGFMRYQSTLGNSYVNSIAESVNQIDAILYTNFLGGGNIGTGGGGVTFNGSIISKDEAMVVWSLPMTQNYDNRIRERTSNQKPLIDITLPRSPTMFRSTWQDRGFSTN